MKFKFSLDSVLKVRKHEEKVQKQKLANEVLKKNEIDTLQQNVKSTLKNYLNGSDTQKAESIHNIKMHATYLEQVHSDMNELNQQKSKVNKAVSRERKRLEKVHKKRHVLEKVKEFEYKIFSKNAARKEQNVLDEIATQSYSR